MRFDQVRQYSQNDIMAMLRDIATYADLWRWQGHGDVHGLVSVSLDTDGFVVTVRWGETGKPVTTQTQSKMLSFVRVIGDPEGIFNLIEELAQHAGLEISPEKHATYKQYYGHDPLVNRN